jgi:hypothetical protein
MKGTTEKWFLFLSKKTASTMLTVKTLERQPFFKHVFGGIAIGFGNRCGKRDAFWTSLNAVLRVSAFLQAALSQQCLEAFFFVHGPCRMGIE